MPLVGLRPNERVRTPDGLGTVVSVDAVEGEQPVWNLEVHGTHTYHAGSGGVLVHNNGDCFADVFKHIRDSGPSVWSLGAQIDTPWIGGSYDASHTWLLGDN